MFKKWLATPTMRAVLLSLVVLVAFPQPVWSTTSGASGKIAFMRGRHIVLSDPDGGNVSRLSLPSPSFNPVWSPDGSRILVTTFTPAGVRPATVDPDGSDFVLRDVQVPSDFEIHCRAWSPDGRRLLCQGLRFESDHSMDGVYSIRASDGGGLRRLTVNPFPPTGDFGGGDIPGDYSPDGTQFVFMRAKPGDDPSASHQQGALFVANVDGSGLHRITPYGLANSHDNGLARWSPDGSRIVFASARGLLFVVLADGTGLRRVPLDTRGDWYFALTPDWSPDGTAIVFSLFVFHGQAGQEDIYTARPDGSQLTQVTDTANSFEDFADWGTHPWGAV